MKQKKLKLTFYEKISFFVKNNCDCLNENVTLLKTNKSVHQAIAKNLHSLMVC